MPSWVAACYVNKREEPFYETSALRGTESKLSIVNCWILSQVFDTCQQMWHLIRQAKQKSCFFRGLDENVSKFSSQKANSRANDHRTFPCGTTAPTKSVHAVVSVIHEKVDCTSHSHVQLWKSISTSEQRKFMSDDTFFRYCGTALHRMIKLRKETLKQKRVVGKSPLINDVRLWRDN